MEILNNLKNLLNIKQAPEGEKEWLSYRWTTLFQWDTINRSTGVYYNLYRQNTDLRRWIEELYQTVWKDWYVLLQNGNQVMPQNIIDALNFCGFNTLKSLIIRDLQIAWNDFLVDVTNPSWAIIGWQNLDPRTMQIVADAHWTILWYRQTVNADVATFWTDELVHSVDAVDPDNEVWWISKIETLTLDILSDKEATSSNYAFFKNNAIPSTIITLDNELWEKEIKIALEQLKNQFSGWSNQHKVSASNWIKDVKVIGSTMKDMEFSTLRWLTTEKVCAALWVPRTILWYSDWINYSTSDNQYRKYIENTIRPLQNEVEDIFNRLIARIDPTVTFKFIDNFQFDMDSKIDRSIKLFEHWALTVNELREITWEEAFTEDMADKPLIRQWFEILEDVWLNTFDNNINNENDAK